MSLIAGVVHENAKAKSRRVVLATLGALCGIAGLSLVSACVAESSVAWWQGAFGIVFVILATTLLLVATAIRPLAMPFMLQAPPAEIRFEELG